MAADRLTPGTGATGAGTDDGELTPTRLIARPERQTSAAAPVSHDDHYDVLDDRETEFEWRPAAGGVRPGSADLPTAPTWVRRSAARKTRVRLKNGLAWLFTLSCIAAVLIGAYAIVSRRPSAPGNVPSPAATAPAPAAAAPTTTPAAPPPAHPDATDTSRTSTYGPTPPLDGEDGPPAPTPEEEPPSR